MIVACEGWNDAGESATDALEHLARQWEAEPVAALDPEEYYDFQVNRPALKVVGVDLDLVGHARSWPLYCWFPRL